MLLFFDSETSGLPRSHHAAVSDLANWPRIVQIAWQRTDQQGTTQQAMEAIIRPDGFSIPADAARVHGITTARALTEGLLLPQVLNQFLAALRQGVTATSGPGSMNCTAICLAGGWAQPTTPWWMWRPARGVSSS